MDKSKTQDKDFIDILIEAICYLLSYSEGGDLSMKEKTNTVVRFKNL